METISLVASSNTYLSEFGAEQEDSVEDQNDDDHLKFYSISPPGVDRYAARNSRSFASLRMTALGEGHFSPSAIDYTNGRNDLMSSHSRSESRMGRFGFDTARYRASGWVISLGLFNNPAGGCCYL